MHFLAKYKSIIHNNAFSSEKVHALLFSHIKIHRHICLDFGLFLLVNCGWAVNILLLIQRRLLFQIIEDCVNYSSKAQRHHLIYAFTFIYTYIAFPENWNHNLGIAKAMYFCLSHRNAFNLQNQSHIRTFKYTKKKERVQCSQNQMLF